MSKYKIGENVVWEEIKGETTGNYSYVRREAVSLSKIQYEILDVLIRNTVLYNNYMHYDDIGREVNKSKGSVAYHHN